MSSVVIALRPKSVVGAADTMAVRDEPRPDGLYTIAPTLLERWRKI